MIANQLCQFRGSNQPDANWILRKGNVRWKEFGEIAGSVFSNSGFSNEERSRQETRECRWDGELGDEERQDKGEHDHEERGVEEEAP